MKSLFCTAVLSRLLGRNIARSNCPFKMSKRKLPGIAESEGGNPNQDLIDMLFELSNFEKNVSRNTFKSNAYRKVSENFRLSTSSFS